MTALCRILMLGLFATLLTGCGSVPPVAPAASETSPAPAPAPVAATHVIDAAQSDVRFLVFRAGTLARLGHNHVVRAAAIDGQIVLADELRLSSFVLRLPVAGFRVDEPALRAEEGEAFASVVSAEAAAGTRNNMLGEAVLDAGRHPQVEIRSLSISGPAWAPDVTLAIRLRGVEHRQTVPVALDRQPGRLVATAVFEVRQSDFGIVPFSVLGGALQVADTLRVRMRLVAVPAESPR